MLEVTRTKLVLVSLLVTSAWIALILTLHPSIDKTSEFELPMDHHKYAQMANSDFGSMRTAPYCWRVGVPEVVKLLPIQDFRLSFLLLAIASVLMTSVLIAVISYDNFGDPLLALTLSLMYLSLGWLTKYGIINPYLVDVELVACSALVLFALHRGISWLYLVSLLAGMLTKESMIIVAITALFIKSSTLDLRVRVSGLVMCASVILVLRVLIPAGNSDPAYLQSMPATITQVQSGDSSYEPIRLFFEIGINRFFSPAISDINAYLLDSFGVLLGCAVVLTILRVPLLRIPSVVTISLAVATTMFASNIQRPLLSVAFVLLYILAVSSVFYGDFTRRRLEIFVSVCAVFGATVVVSRPSLSSIYQIGIFLLVSALIRIWRMFASSTARVD